MNKQLKIWSLVLSMLAVVAMNSCKDDPALPDNLVNFETTAVGFTGTETSIKITASRAVDTDTPITVSFVGTNAVYGTHFTTVPAATASQITLVIPANSTEATLAITKPAGIFLNGDESIDFTINTVTEPVLLGETSTVKVSFSAITSEGSTLTLQGKTDVSPYANSVYVDLSANQQILVDRKSWNLGFLSGTDFKVILNPGYQTTAAPLTKTDITTVTLADAETVLNLAHDAIITDPATNALADAWDGDLTKTTFATVSATDSENKVYLLSFEGNKTKDKWFKIKVTRDGTTGYKVQYARIGDTTIKSITVAKNSNYNLSFLSLETDKVVSVEPIKGNWDIEWSYSTVNSGLNTPYWGQDVILSNYLNGTESIEMVSTGADVSAASLAAATAYTNFSEANLTGLTFLKTRDAIGNKWRNTTGAPLGVKFDRFYVIKDSRGNYYKLKFISFGVPAGSGVRGNPVIEYKLVKKAS